MRRMWSGDGKRIVFCLQPVARELERSNPNRATLAVARKMAVYMLAVERRYRLRLTQSVKIEVSIHPTYATEAYTTFSARGWRLFFEG